MQYDDCLLHLPLASHIRTCACLNLTSNRWTKALGPWRPYFAWWWLSRGCTLVIGLIMSLFALDFLFALSTFKLIISTVFPHLYDWTGYGIRFIWRWWLDNTRVARRILTSDLCSSWNTFCSESSSGIFFARRHLIRTFSNRKTKVIFFTDKMRGFCEV